jgi:hypothetical protein
MGVTVKPRSGFRGCLFLVILLIVVAIAGTVVAYQQLGPERIAQLFPRPAPTESATPKPTEAKLAGDTTTSPPTLVPATPAKTAAESPTVPTTPSPPTKTFPKPTDTPPPTATMSAGEGVQVSSESSSKSGIRVELLLADGQPKRRSWVGIYEQKVDISNNPIKGQRVADGRTDDAGQTFFALNSGTYAVELGDIAGYRWPHEFGYTVRPGEATVIKVTFGRIFIGVTNAEGRGLSGRWTGIYLQKQDVSGNPIKGDRTADGRTDDTGKIVYDLVPGTYAVEVHDLSGQVWGEELNHQVGAGQTVNLLVKLGRLTVGVRNAEQKPVPGRWVGVYFQKQDVSGNPIKGDRFLDGRTDNTGVISWDLTAGTYAVEIRDVAGKLWGEEMNHTISAGETTTIILDLGRLVVALKGSDGKGIPGRWVGVYLQKMDVGGELVQGDRFLEGRTDQTGAAAWDLTAGNYVVEVQDVGKLMDVAIRAGATTTTDGVRVEGP